MVIGIIGESCTGKSSIADELSRRLSANVFTGKDYLKLAKTEAAAEKQFIEMLILNENNDNAIIYVITEPEHIAFLPPKAIRVLVTAELDIIKERFAKRMNGKLPPPVAAMLEKKHGMFDNENHDLRIENIKDDIVEVCDRIIALCNS